MTTKRVPKFRITNEFSAVQDAIGRLGGYEGVARVTNSQISTVQRWRLEDRFPAKHIAAISEAAAVAPMTLLGYSQKYQNRYHPNKKSLSLLDQVEEAHNYPKKSTPRRIKQLVTLWGGKIPTLRKVFKSLTAPHDGQKAYGETVRECATTLGVGTKRVYSLMKEFGIKRQQFESSKVREEKKSDVMYRNQRAFNECLTVIKGTKTGQQAADSLNVSVRTVWRGVEEMLRPLDPLKKTTKRDLMRYPLDFRLAVAYDVSSHSKDWASSKLKKIYDENPPKNLPYKAPDDLVHASYHDKLIAVMMSETSMRILHAMTGVQEDRIEDAFDGTLTTFGLTWAEVSEWSQFHQAVLASIIRGKSHVR